MSAFDFGQAAATAEAFTPPLQDRLPKGNYVLTVVDLENSTTKTANAYPMLKLRLESEEGVQWDNIVISPNDFSVAKLFGFIDATGVARPSVEAGEIDPYSGRLSDGYCAKLRGKKVGTIVRDEEDDRPDHRGEKQPRVRGYCTPDKIAGKTGALANGNGAPKDPAGSGADEEIPF